jgi:hypothetical protein
MTNDKKNNLKIHNSKAIDKLIFLILKSSFLTKEDIFIYKDKNNSPNFPNFVKILDIKLNKKTKFF